MVQVYIYMVPPQMSTSFSVYINLQCFTYIFGSKPVQANHKGRHLGGGSIYTYIYIWFQRHDARVYEGQTVKPPARGEQVRLCPVRRSGAWRRLRPKGPSETSSADRCARSETPDVVRHRDRDHLSFFLSFWTLRLDGAPRPSLKNISSTNW